METEGRIFDEFSGLSGIHFCPDWDYMLVWAGTHEYRACQCYPTGSRWTRQEIEQAKEDAEKTSKLLGWGA